MHKKRVPSKKQDTAAVTSEISLVGEEFLALQMMLCTPDVGIDVTTETNSNVVNLQQVAKTGSFSLYNQFKPRDPAEAMLSALSVGVTNATMDCFSEAARAKAYPQIRDMNLRHGFRGAVVATKLLDALQRRRRQDPKAVSVGKVNIEAGGQAIVGHVESRGDRKASGPNNSPTAGTTDPEEAEE